MGEDRVVALMPEARRVARGITSRWTAMDLEEVISIAYEELVKLDRKYDPARGVPYEPFVVGHLWWRVFGRVRAVQTAIKGTGRNAVRVAKRRVEPLEPEDGSFLDWTEHPALAVYDVIEDPSGLRDAVEESLATLGRRTREIILASTVGGESLLTVGERYGITESRVCQLRNRFRRDVMARWRRVNEAA